MMRVPMSKEHWQALKEQWIDDDGVCAGTNLVISELLDEAEAARENEQSLYEAQEQEPQYHCQTCRCGLDEPDDFEYYHGRDL